MSAALELFFHLWCVLHKLVCSDRRDSWLGPLLTNEVDNHQDNLRFKYLIFLGMIKSYFFSFLFLFESCHLMLNIK